VGVTGISDLGGAYAQNGRSIHDHERAIEAGRLYTERGIVLTDEDRERRAIIVDLLCNGRAMLGDDAPSRFAPELEALRGLERDGLLVTDGHRVDLSELGRTFARNVAMVFDTYLRDQRQPTFSQTI
jgi:oxygen-independent coproporphyrinogen-3 oxidase